MQKVKNITFLDKKLGPYFGKNLKISKKNKNFKKIYPFNIAPIDMCKNSFFCYCR